MNALQHGLDAQILVLPGEDEASFRARLDAWMADIRPRNPVEHALVEEAVRLPWQLDRADRVQAAVLADRIRVAGDEEARRRDREAAEAAAVGRRLINGPPVADLPGDRRRALPIHPDDPDHPARLLRRLEATDEGCRWLLDRWAGLRAKLVGVPDACWRPEERRCAVRLLARQPVDALDDPMVRAIYLCCFVLDPDGPQVFADQADDLTEGEFHSFVEQMAARRFCDHVSPDRESAREGLLALVDGIIARPESLEAAHAGRAEVRAATAPTRLAFGDGPEAERPRRLHRRLANAMLRMIDLLCQVRRDPDAASIRHGPRPAPEVESREILAPGPVSPVDREEVRNEPNAAREEMRNDPTAVGSAVNPAGERAARGTKRTQGPRVDRERRGSAPRIDGTNPTGRSPRATERPRTTGARTARVRKSPVRPSPVRAHRRQSRPAARPPPRRPVSLFLSDLDGARIRDGRAVRRAIPVRPGVFLS